jgi:hypothetical protein
MPRLGRGGAQADTSLFKLCLELEPQELAYGYFPTASTPVKYLLVLAMAARKIIATSKDGGCQCGHFSSHVRSFFTTVTQKNIS